jgi:FkbM family methyltransferase
MPLKLAPLRATMQPAPWRVLPHHLRPWAREHIQPDVLSRMLQNASSVSLCLKTRRPGRGCERQAVFHVSALDNLQKVRAESYRIQSWRRYNVSLAPNSWMIDVGGNLGIVAVAAVLLSRGCIRVASLEPNPETHLLQRWNLWENNITELHHHLQSGCGVLPLNEALTADGRNISLIVGVRSMNAHAEGAMWSTTDKLDAIGGARDPLLTRRGTVDRASAFRRYMVKSTSLGELLQRYNLSHTVVDLLKVDCEVRMAHRFEPGAPCTTDTSPTQRAEL